MEYAKNVYLISFFHESYRNKLKKLMRWSHT